MTELLRNYLLTVIFFAAGFFVYHSLKKKSFTQFWKDKIVNLYVPFLILLILIYFSGRYPTVQPEAWLYHATGVNLVHNYQLTTLNLHHLWFVPQLLVYFLMISVLEKKVKNLGIISIAWGLFLVANLLLWDGQSEFRLMRRMYVFVIPFIVGFYLSKHNLLERVLNNNTLMAALIVSAIATITFEPLKLSDRTFILTNTLHYNLLGLSLTILSLRSFRYLKSKVLHNLTRSISRAGLFIYLSHTVPMMWFSQQLSSSSAWYAVGLLDTNQTIIMLILCIPFTIALGYIGYQAFQQISQRLVSSSG
jgi:surface polysaccharide O-acyltransferase-like enzyme